MKVAAYFKKEITDSKNAYICSLLTFLSRKNKVQKTTQKHKK